MKNTQLIDDICRTRKETLQSAKTLEKVCDEFEGRLTLYTDANDVCNVFYAWLQYQIAELNTRLDALDRLIFGKAGKEGCTLRM